MKVKLPSGVILEPATDDVAKQLLKYGGEEVVEKKLATKTTPKKVAEK